MSGIHFLTAADAEELTKALRAEGYAVDLVELPEHEVGAARFRLDVTPFDDDAVAMVDVYGGWLPEEAP